MEKNIKRKSYREMSQTEQKEFINKIMRETQNESLLYWASLDTTIELETLDGEKVVGKIRRFDQFSIKINTIEYGDLVFYKSALKSIRPHIKQPRSEKDFFESKKKQQ